MTEPRESTVQQAYDEGYAVAAATTKPLTLPHPTPAHAQAWQEGWAAYHRDQYDKAMAPLREAYPDPLVDTLRNGGYVDIEPYDSLDAWREDVIDPVVRALRDHGWTVTPPEAT